MSTHFDNDPEFNDVPKKPRSKRRFRVVPVLTVLGIMALLIALLLPVSRTSRSAAHRSQCANNLKQIALALKNYALVYDGLPPAYTVDAKGRPLHSWRTLVLPYLEQQSLYQTIDLSKPWNDPVNVRAKETDLPVFRCPEAAGPRNTTTYLALAGPNGCLIPRESQGLEEITDAHGTTLMLIEAGEENAVPWMAPVDADESLVMGLGPSTKLHHAGGTNACLVDGHVLFLKVSTPARARRALMSISGDDDDVAKKGD